MGKYNKNKKLSKMIAAALRLDIDALNTIRKILDGKDKLFLKELGIWKLRKKISQI